MLRVEHLCVVPPGATTPACSDVSFTLGRGERAAIVGASGAGKTTLLRAVNGTMPAQSGSVLIGDRRLDPRNRRTLRALRRRIAVIPQKHDLVDNLRVYHNVMAGALGRWSDLRALRFLLWPLPGELDEAGRALERVDLREKLRVRADTLSGGQQQRVAIARALVQQPLLILADEPVASLDPRMAHQVLALLCELAERDGVALLCTLHQPDLAAQYFPRILTMSGGRLTDDRRVAPPPAARPRPVRVPDMPEWQAVGA
ncbi:MAG TPA: ATP-binding cassette domain-containing protein [Xanthobacteraceae bacterium]|nr:ATP-binding cassette domain-containing protein [Xanthobacteraceae bacterium]